jgi:hypothetical protein
MLDWLIHHFFMSPQVWAKFSIATPLMCALHMVVTCPCDPVLECHKLAFFGLLLLSAAAALTILGLGPIPAPTIAVKA